MANNTTESATSTDTQTLYGQAFSTSEAVVDAVAEADGISSEEVWPPLYEVIDPDALDDLFASPSLRTDRTRGRVVFPYCGYEVTVYGDGRVRLDD